MANASIPEKLRKHEIPGHVAIVTGQAGEVDAAEVEDLLLAIGNEVS